MNRKLATALAGAIIGGIAIGVFEIHRLFIALVWPYMTAFWFEFIAF